MSPMRSTPRATPGLRLIAFAERLFDRLTLDRVVIPAIADLQHECLRAPTASLSHRVIRCRAHWGVLRTIALCALRDVATDRRGASRSITSRMLLLLPLFVLLGALPGSGWLWSFGVAHGAGVAVEAGLLLLLPSLVLALPVAFYFAVALQRRASGMDRLSVVALSILWAAVMSALMLAIVPETNQSYRMLLFEAFQRDDASVPRARHLPKGLTEMTLTELNDEIANPPSPAREALARHHRQERFAYIAAVPLMGLVALVLARRRGDRKAAIVADILLLGIYFASFNVDVLRNPGVDIYRAWTANVVLAIIGLGLGLIPARALSPETSR